MGRLADGVTSVLLGVAGVVVVLEFVLDGRSRTWARILEVAGVTLDVEGSGDVAFLTAGTDCEDVDGFD